MGENGVHGGSQKTMGDLERGHWIRFNSTVGDIGASFIESVCSRSNPKKYLDPPKSKWHNRQSRVNEMGNGITKNTDFCTVF